MQAQIDDARRQALKAREEALRAGDERLKEEWLKASRTWDAVAHEYVRLQALSGESRTI